LPRVIAPLWNGVVAPVGTPREVIQRLNTEINAALAQPEVRARLQSAGMEILGGPPDRLARMMRDEATKWSPIVQRTGVQLD
jgi:tripartite-type tricarboxylate transporter receptor subunit TctC